MQNTMSMNDMVAALVKQPEANRKAMMTDRMEMFAEMDEASRTQAMGAMLDALYALPDGDFQKMVDTRTAVLADLDEATRRKLMKTHMALLQQHSEGERMREMKTVQAAVQKLSPEKRKPMMQMMQNMMPASAAIAPQLGHKPATASRPTARTAPASTHATTLAHSDVTPAANAHTWAAWLALVLGAWIVISPFVFVSGATAQIHDVILGFVVAVLGLTGALGRQSAWADWLNVLAGLWLIVGSLLLGFTGAFLISNILSGIVLAVLGYVAASGVPKR